MWGRCQFSFWGFISLRSKIFKEKTCGIFPSFSIIFHHFPSFFYMIWTFSVFVGKERSWKLQCIGCLQDWAHRIDDFQFQEDREQGVARWRGVWLMWRFIIQLWLSFTWILWILFLCDPFHDRTVAVLPFFAWQFSSNFIRQGCKLHPQWLWARFLEKDCCFDACPRHPGEY